MQGQKIIRVILFILFCGVGLAVLSGTVLLDELIGYYSDKAAVKSQEEHIEKLKILNDDYDVLLDQLEKDPNFAERIADVTLGTGHKDANVVYPKATPEQMDATRKALAENSVNQPPPAVPGWLLRCRERNRRILLFSAGGFLILLSFICFGPMKKINEAQE